MFHANMYVYTIYFLLLFNIDALYPTKNPVLFGLFISSFQKIYVDTFKSLWSQSFCKMNEELKENLAAFAKRKSHPSDYPNAVRIDKELIPVYDAQSLCSKDTSYPLQLILQDLDINDPGGALREEEIATLSKLFHANCELLHASLKSYKSVIEEIVRSLTLDGPGVCVVENVFSEDFMTRIQDWVDDYLDRDTSSRHSGQNSRNFNDDRFRRGLFEIASILNTVQKGSLRVRDQQADLEAA